MLIKPGYTYMYIYYKQHTKTKNKETLKYNCLILVTKIIRHDKYLPCNSKGWWLICRSHCLYPQKSVLVHLVIWPVYHENVNVLKSTMLNSKIA